MIAFLDGTLAGKTLNTAYLNVNGVGFAVVMSATDISKLPEKDSRVQVFTYLSVRDDGFTLYGFLTQDEKSIFEELISVSGIGPNVALAALSTLKPAEIASAISAQDIQVISSIPGVGKKTAQRIILELQGSIVLTEEVNLFTEAAQNEKQRLKGAHEALLSMGFTSQEADLALQGAPEDARSDSALLQYALKRLGG